jgi:hypothetical protein
MCFPSAFFLISQCKALGLDYWVVPEASTFHLSPYKLSDEAIEAIRKTVLHLLQQKGMPISPQPKEDL